jgi:hypothetical protein
MAHCGTPDAGRHIIGREPMAAKAAGASTTIQMLRHHA